MSESLKSAIIKGTAHTDTLWVPELDREVTVRPLSDAEAGEAKAAALAGQKVRGPVGGRPTDYEADVKTSTEGQAEARRIKVAYGLSVNGDKWTPKEIGRYLPAGAVRRIAAKVDELSGGDELAEEARQFRDDTAGAGDGDPAPDGDSAGGDAGAAD